LKVRRKPSPATKSPPRISGCDTMTWINIIIQGILVGGLYALFAAGLSLIFGVMRLVNIAHGDLIIAVAYLAWSIVHATGLHPLVSLVLVVPIAMGFGYALQYGILNRTLGKDILPPLLVTFGLSVIIQNGLLEIFTADPRKLSAGALEQVHSRCCPASILAICHCCNLSSPSLSSLVCNIFSTTPPLAVPSVRHRMILKQHC
jgi:branched-subunit amino acid ABC-type transport system permease component